MSCAWAAITEAEPQPLQEGLHSILQRASVASNTGHLIGDANPHQRAVREPSPSRR